MVAMDLWLRFFTRFDVVPAHARTMASPSVLAHLVTARYDGGIPSNIVGPKGRVCSLVPAEVAHFKYDPGGRMRALAKEPGRENVEAVAADLVATPEATRPGDVLWLHLFYQDLQSELIRAKGATAANFNRAVYERLKPSGYCVTVDHT